MYRAPLPWGAGPEPALRLVAAGNTQLASIPTDRGVTLDPVPLATRAYAAFQQFTAKAEYAYDYGMPQWVARADHALAPLHLERLFLGRHKFYHFRVWYRDQLAAYVRDVLLDPRSLARPYLDARTVRDMVTRHTAGTANFTSEIHRLLSLELSQRQLFEAP
jgi:asparagine synthase (glutamine-hydrolysing)